MRKHSPWLCEGEQPKQHDGLMPDTHSRFGVAHGELVPHHQLLLVDHPEIEIHIRDGMGAGAYPEEALFARVEQADVISEGAPEVVKRLTEMNGDMRGITDITKYDPIERAARTEMRELRAF